LKPRAGGGIEVEVHDILIAADRADEVNGHLRGMTQNAAAAQSAQAFYRSDIIVMANPASSDVLKAFQVEGQKQARLYSE